MNVVQFKATRRKASKVRGETKKLKRQATAGMIVGLVGVCLMALSLDHLANGIQLITGDDAGWQSWLMAIGVDCGFIALELGMIFAHLDRVKKVVFKYARPTIFLLMVGSAGLNALAFGWQSHGLLMYGAVVLGLAVPVLIYVLTKVGVALWSH